nr:Translation initiation factor IF-2, N-terminal region [uncultured bacterium]
MIAKKRIHELAKDWDVQTKDVLSKLERLGIRNKKSQSSLSDEQIVQVRAALGLRDKATVTIGAERVVADRVVTDTGADQIVTSREQVVENRVRANVIRRRTTRVEVLKTEDIAPAEAAEPATPSLAPVSLPSIEPTDFAFPTPVDVPLPVGDRQYAVLLPAHLIVTFVLTLKNQGFPATEPGIGKKPSKRCPHPTHRDSVSFRSLGVYSRFRGLPASPGAERDREANSCNSLLRAC